MVMVTENVKHIGRLNGIVVENWMENKNILLTLFADYILIVGGQIMAIDIKVIPTLHGDEAMRFINNADEVMKSKERV